MTELVRMRRRGATMTAIVALAAMLAACNPNPASQNVAGADPNQTASLPPLPATLPLDSAPATPIATAPVAARLPAAAPIRTVRVAQPDQAWAYADDARDFTEVVYDAPPDYGFDYDGVEPWAWQGYDDSLVFAEPIDDGYRYYYYRPGAGRPYYVRDPDYGYGYDGDRLAVVYGPRGDVLPYDSYGPRADYAGRYLSRGEALYRASRDRQRRAVIAANWAARQQAIAQSQRRWAEEQARQRDWQAYHARTAQRAASYWQVERARRADDTRRYAEWRGRGFQAAPPPRVIPARWQQADWARDRSRYVAEARQAQAQRIQAVQRQQAEQRRDVAEQLRQQQLAQQRGQQQAAQQRAAQMQRAALDQRRQQLVEAQRARATQVQQQQLRQRQVAQQQAQAAQRAAQAQRQVQVRQQQLVRQQQRATQVQRQAQVRQQQAVRQQAQRAQQVRQQQVAQQRAAQVQAQARGRQQAVQRQAQLQNQRAAQARAQQAQAARNAQADRARQMAAQRQVQASQRQAQAAQARQAQAAQRQVQVAQRQAQVAQRQAQARQAQAARPQPARPPRPAPGPQNRPDRKDHR